MGNVIGFRAATKQLLADRIHPMSKFADRDGNIPSPWSVKPWIVYEFTDASMLNAIDYVKDNVKRARLPVQQHSFVVPYRSRA